MQMQALVMPAPGGCDLLLLFKDDEIQSGLCKTGACRQSCRARADDDDVCGFFQFVLPSLPGCPPQREYRSSRKSARNPARHRIENCTRAGRPRPSLHAEMLRQFEALSLIVRVSAGAIQRLRRLRHFFVDEAAD